MSDERKTNGEVIHLESDVRMVRLHELEHGQKRNQESLERHITWVKSEYNGILRPFPSRLIVAYVYKMYHKILGIQTSLNN